MPRTLPPWALAPGLLMSTLIATWASTPVPAQAAPVLTNAAQAPRDNTLYATGEGATARLRGDATALPASAARCANCHELARQPTGSDGSFGPRLDARLAQPLPRRGGPPSAYDASTLCTLLRTGIDPAGVLVRRSMPVYEIDNAACVTMWQALSRRAPMAQLSQLQEAPE